MAERRPNRYLAGRADEEFWAWCDRGELRLQRCGQCGQLTWPVAEGCEYCGSAALTWERMSGRGRIVSWVTFVQDYYGGLLPTPYDAILVELEEGVLFTSNPLGFTADETEADMAVSLAFIDCEDDAGPFRLPVFEKA
jgi:uncharacterized OB-fold protein